MWWRVVRIGGLKSETQSRLVKQRVVKISSRGKSPEKTSMDPAINRRSFGRDRSPGFAGPAQLRRNARAGARNPRDGRGGTTPNNSGSPPMVVIQQPAQALAANDLAFGPADLASWIDASC